MVGREGKRQQESLARRLTLTMNRKIEIDIQQKRGFATKKIKFGDDEYGKDQIYDYVSFDPISPEEKRKKRQAKRDEEERKKLEEMKAEGKEIEIEIAKADKMKRSGVVGMKIGMMGVYDAWGERHTCTILQLDNVEVTQVKTPLSEGQLSIQMGISQRKEKRIRKPQVGHFHKAGVDPKRKLVEFQVEEEQCLIPIGTKIDVRHFVPGQYVDVCGTSKGKGFAGVMKRWNFKGQGATHGVSLTHRSGGSTGQNTSPGRVFKGKKMPGHLGAERVTVLNQQIFKIDIDRQLVYLKGHVPGPTGGYIRIRDAVQGAKFPSPPPIPTYLGGGEEKEREIFAPLPEVNPLMPKVFEE